MKKYKKTTTKNPDITEHEQSVDALHQSEERFRQMVDLLPEAVCEFDISGNILFGNRAAFIMVGYDQADFEKGLNILPMIAPEDQERAFTNRQRMLTGEALGADEYTLVRKDGSRFPATVHIANILNASGKTVGFRGIVIDITARRQPAEMQQRLAAIVTSSHDAIIGKTLDGIITSWNKGAEEHYGYPAAEVIGRSIAVIIPPDRVDELPRFLETIRRGGAVIDYESERITKDGRRVTVLLTISPIKDASGKVVGASTVAQDVTERKRVEERLARLSLQNKLILSSAAEGIMGLDLQGNHTFINPAAARMMGYEVEELISRHSHSTWHHTKADGSPYPKEECNIYAAYRDGVVYSASNEVFWRKDGSSFPVEYTSTPIYEQGRLAGAVVTFADITQRKQVEMALRERLKELNCLYGISAVLEVPGLSLDEILKRVALIMPPAWQFPDITEACIVLRGQTFQTEHFRETSWMQVSEIVVNGKTVGQIRVCYLKERRSSDEGPFMIEERHLLDAIAERLGRVIERVWAEETLQQSEERYRSLFVESRDAVMILSPDEGFLAGNPAAIEMFGCRDEQDFTSRTPNSLSPEYQPDGALSVDRSLEMMRIALEKGSHSFEWMHRRADGTDFNATVLLSRMGSGGKRLLQATVRDITESKKADAEILVLSNAFRAALDPILILDLEGKVINVNEAARRLFETEELGVSALDYAVPEDREKIITAIQGLIAGSSVNTTEFTIVTKSGRRVPIEATGSLIRNANGKANGFVIVERDITERKRTQEALRQFVDRLSLATRAGGVGIWDYDVIDNKLIWDDQMYHLYGITQDKFGGAYEAWRAGLHPEDMQRGDNEIQLALRGEKEFDTEFRVLWLDGTIRNIRALAIVQRDASGKPLRMIGTNWDITERKQAEAEREKTIQELQSAIEQIKTLKGLVPICAWCKKVRNDKGYWEQVEAYVSRYTEAQFSHGICPDCVKKAYPEFSKDEKTDSK